MKEFMYKNSTTSFIQHTEVISFSKRLSSFFMLAFTLSLPCPPPFCLKADENFFLEENLQQVLFSNIKVSYQVHDSIIGSARLQEIFPRTYVIYNFYIHPKDRNQGYGHELLRHMCQQVHKKGSSIIFVQPGPFELHKVLTESERKERLQKLTEFYEKEGFKPANIILQKLASWVYLLVGISENSDYLLTQVLD